MRMLSIRQQRSHGYAFARDIYSWKDTQGARHGFPREAVLGAINIHPKKGTPSAAIGIDSKIIIPIADQNSFLLVAEVCFLFWLFGGERICVASFRASASAAVLGCRPHEASRIAIAILVRCRSSSEFRMQTPPLASLDRSEAHLFHEIYIDETSQNDLAFLVLSGIILPHVDYRAQFEGGYRLSPCKTPPVALDRYQEI